MESSSSVDKEPTSFFEVFELVEQEPPQLWRTDSKSRQDVPLTPLEARLLVFLAQRPRRWVTIEALADEVWNDSETGANSIQVAIWRLRRKLRGFEHVIESGQSKYRLNSSVSRRTESSIEQVSSMAGRARQRPFAVTWWVLAPFFPGTAPPANPAAGITRVNKVTDAAEYKTQDQTLRLTWYDYGAAVWIETRRRSFPNIAAIAREREVHYDEILSGNHAICELTEEIQREVCKVSRVSPSVQSAIGYAVSLIGVEELPWTPAETDHALKLLSCPSLVLSYTKVESRNAALQHEADFLRHGVPLPDAKPFNIAGTVRGHASWAGVSFHLPPAQRPVFEHEFISYEARLQALWLFLDHHIKLLDRRTIRTITPRTKEQVQAQSRLVFGAGRVERTPLRLFKEAVIASSRIEQLWETFQRRL
jgi:DNA-binding winged helix-turn-helix (wHTH) protein